MITVTVSGADPQRAKLAAKIAELFLAMGLPTLHYPKANLKPPQYPDGLEVAVLETTALMPVIGVCQHCGRPDPKAGYTGFSMHIPPKEGTGDA